MNPTTPEQARQLAKQLSEIVYREDEHHTLLWNCCEQSAGYLRSLADQVEALTAELNNVGLPKLAMCPACTEEVPMLQCDQLTQDAKRYRWLRDTNCDFSIRSPREYWEPLQVPAIFFGHEVKNWHLLDGVCTAWTGSDFDAAMDRAINADDETKRGWKEANSGGIPMRIKSVSPSLLRAAIAKGTA